MRFRNNYGNVEQTLQLSEAVLGKQIADLEEERVTLKSRLDSGDITMEEFSKEDKLLEADMMEICEAKGFAAARMGMRELILFGQNVQRKNDAMEIFNHMVAKAEKMMEGTLAGTDADAADGVKAAASRADITAEELFRIWNAAGVITDADIAQVADFTDASIYYNWKPMDILNVITKRAITNETIKFRFEDSTKVEGLPAMVQKGEVLPLFDYGTKEMSRKLKLVGGQFAWDISIETNSDEAGFLPQVMMYSTDVNNRILSLQLVNGDGPASGAEASPATAKSRQMRGILKETGVQTHGTAIAAGAWSHGKVDEFAEVIASLRENQYVDPTHIVLAPWDVLRIQALWEDNVGYVFANKASDAPQGDSLDMLWGTYLLGSYWLPANTVGGKAGYDIIVADFRNTALYSNGGFMQTEVGRINDDLARLRRRHIQYARVQQFTKDPTKIVKVQKIVAT